MDHHSRADSSSLNGRSSAHQSPGHRSPGALFRNPTAGDAREINILVAACPPLDTNSLYCNLLQCTHFADTCLLAEQGGEIKGWISAYRPANDPDAIFVWQVAVRETARGQGLGLELLRRLLRLRAVRGVSYLKSTVTPSNLTSRALFTSFAAKSGLDLDTRLWFDTNVHFGGQHESELLFSIGPLQKPAADAPPTERIDR